MQNHDSIIKNQTVSLCLNRAKKKKQRNGNKMWKCIAQQCRYSRNATQTHTLRINSHDARGNFGAHKCDEMVWAISEKGSTAKRAYALCTDHVHQLAIVGLPRCRFMHTDDFCFPFVPFAVVSQRSQCSHGLFVNFRASMKLLLIHFDTKSSTN